MYKLICSMIVITILQGCSTSRSLGDSAEYDSFNIHVAHCTYDHEVVESYRPNDEFVLIFPTLPGVISGSPTSDIVQYVATLPNKSFRLNLPKKMGTRAKPLSQKGLTVEPKETKIIRLGTFHAYPEKDDHIGGGMFIDSSTGHYYTLVYFSESASLIGEDQYGDIKTTYDIKNAKSGWNWIRSIEVKKDIYEVSLYSEPNSKIKFCTLVREIIGA